MVECLMTAAQMIVAGACQGGAGSAFLSARAARTRHNKPALIRGRVFLTARNAPSTPAIRTFGLTSGQSTVREWSPPFSRGMCRGRVLQPPPCRCEQVGDLRAQPSGRISRKKSHCVEHSWSCSQSRALSRGAAKESRKRTKSHCVILSPWRSRTHPTSFAPIPRHTQAPEQANINHRWRCRRRPTPLEARQSAAVTASADLGTAQEKSFALTGS